MTQQPPTNPETPQQPTYVTPKWTATTRIFMAVVVVVAIVYGMVLISPLLQTAFLSFTFALILFIPSRALAKRTPLSYKLSVILVYVILVILLILIVLILVPAIIQGVNNLLDALTVAYNNFVAWLEAYQPEDGVTEILGVTVNLDPIIEPIRNFVLGETTHPTITRLEPGVIQVENLSLGTVVSGILALVVSVTKVAAGFIVTVAGFVSTFIFALLISFLLLLDLPGLRGVLGNWIAPDYKREVTLLLDHLDNVWEGFLKGQVIVGFLQGLTAWIVFSILGLPGALPLAILDGTLGMIPSIGGIIAGIPVAIVALLLGSTTFPDMPHWVFMVIVFLVNGILSQLIFTFISPVIMSEKVNLPTILVIFGVAIGFLLGGIMGALLVVPIIGSLRLIFGYILAKLVDRDPFPGQTLPEEQERGFFSQTFSTYPEK